MNEQFWKVLKPDLGRPVQILLVEDSPSDAAMTHAALREGRIANEMHVVADGEDAMAYLRREGRFAQMPRPDLMLLDLNLPRKDGREVLDEIKQDLDLRSIPVIVLTTSSADADIRHAYARHANAYVTKPVGFEPFLAAIRDLEGFWLSLVRFPDGESGGRAPQAGAPPAA